MVIQLYMSKGCDKAIPLKLKFAEHAYAYASLGICFLGRVCTHSLLQEAHTTCSVLHKSELISTDPTVHEHIPGPCHLANVGKGVAALASAIAH